MELEIIDGPASVIARGEEARLIAADPELGKALPACWDGRCDESTACGNCVIKRRHLALLHRVRSPPRPAG
jgi:hypothetical protein